MAAGLSDKQIYNHEYRRLRAIARKIRVLGGEAVYKNRQVIWKLNGKEGIAFYRVIRASNGEVVGILQDGRLNDNL